MSHGGSGRGAVLAPRSRLYQGPFGRIFPHLDPWAPPGVAEDAVEGHLLCVANNEMVEAPGKKPSEILADTTLRDQLDSDFSSDIPAGYTYFGQFIDHDITFDPASSLMRRNDPEGLLNHRTPRLDLDNIYGRGRDDSPYLYDQTDRDKLLTGQIGDGPLPDLPRNHQGRALIGDMRNDENSMVSQLQLAFLRAHNTLVDRARDAGAPDAFDTARRTLHWLYQYIVWNDFVRRVCHADAFGSALTLDSTADGRKRWNLGLSDVYRWKHQPFMPIEFSVAAYRFGHSMVRNAYQTNQPHRGFGNFAAIFDNTTDDPDDLRGFRPMLPANSIQWDWFLQMTTSSGPFPQLARKIDTKLANSLSALHEAEDFNSPLNILAFRNLMRGYRFGLPAGTAVARTLGLTPIDIDPAHDALWFYILKEAEELGGQTLGPVGSIIVCATFAGLLKGDPQSWMTIDPAWTPDEDSLLTADDKQDASDWTLAAIIRLSGLPVAGGDFPS